MITVDEAFEAAADKIEECGWVQGTFGTCEGGYCATGALHAVTNWSPAGESARGTDEYFELVRVYGDAILYAKNVLNEGSAVPGVWLSTWNDRPGRTREEVTAFLRECARSYREARDAAE